MPSRRALRRFPAPVPEPIVSKTLQRQTGRFHVLRFKPLLTVAAFCALGMLPAQARTILFLGSSFTYGAHSAAQHYHPELVKDLNGPDRFGETYAGVPAIFKQFTLQAGL